MAGSRAVDEATRDLDERLATMPGAARLALQARAGAMFAKYLDDDGAEVVKAKHPWPWFITRFDSLQAEDAPPRAALTPRLMPA